MTTATNEVSSKTAAPTMWELEHDPRQSAGPFSSWNDDGSSPEGYFKGKIGPDTVKFYQENGFLVLEDALDSDEVEELNRATIEICRGDSGEVNGVTPAALGESDEDVLKRYLCIHFPHRINQAMNKFIAHKGVVDVMTSVIGPDVKCMQSMLFIKASGKPGQAWHQDELYIPTRDRSLAGGWIAMDDATIENGCLWGIPGSHKPGILWPQHQHDDRRFDCAGESQFPYTEADEVPVEVKAGSIVFFNGYLLHRSLPNLSKGAYRRCLINHYMSASSLLPWYKNTENEPIGTADYRDVEMIAGKDPYEYKGYERSSHAHVRASGEGGCAKAGDDVKVNDKSNNNSA